MSLQRQLKLVSPAVFLEEASPWRSLMLVIGAIALVFGSILVWSAFAQVNEAAVVYGEVRPASSIDIIEHPQGGIVDKVFVKNGAHVKKGDVLLTLHTSRSHAQLKQFLTREMHLQLDRIRLKALLAHQSIHAIDWQPAFKHVSHFIDKADEQRFMEAEAVTFKQQFQDFTQQLHTLQLETKKYETEVEKFSKQVRSSQKNYALHLKELAMYDQLIQKQYVSKREHLAAQRKANSAKSDADTAQHQLDYAQRELKEYQAKYQAESHSMHNELQLSLDKINTELAEIQPQIETLQAEVKRHRITAPTAGKITALVLKHNSVIGPDEKILEIVPDTRNYVINARLSTKDVGHVRVGNPAKIKILTYDYARYGGLDGTVTHIASNTHFAEDNVPYYEINITPKQHYMADNPKLTISTGMTAQADIVTGHKSILHYMLSPIHKSMSAAMQER